MFKIDDATAVGVIPTPGAAGTPGYFTEGDPGGSVPATVVTADWLNAVQEEIAYAITQTGGTLSKTDRTQLYTAMVTLVAPDASETVKGKAEIATQAEALTGTDDARIMTPLKVAGLTQKLTAQTITATKLYTFNHTLGAIPRSVNMFIKCLVADGGYSIGDVVPITCNAVWPITSGGGSVYGHATKVTSTTVVLSIDSNQTLALHEWASDGGFGITASSWEAYYVVSV